MFTFADFALLAGSAVAALGLLHFIHWKETRFYRDRFAALERARDVEKALYDECKARLARAMDREVELHRRIAALQGLLDAKLRDGLQIPPVVRAPTVRPAGPKDWSDAAQAALKERTTEMRRVKNSQTTDDAIAVNAAAQNNLVAGLVIGSALASDSKTAAPAPYSPPYEAPATCDSGPSGGDSGGGE